MIFGTFDSKYGIYKFGNKHYTARWYANATQMRIDEMKPILEEAYSAGGQKWQRGVLVAGISQWKKIVDGGFGSWVGLAQLHCYDATMNAGTVPEWANEFEGYGGFLIHEYAPGKIVFMREEKDLYIFFKDSPPPPVVPPVDDPIDDPIEDPLPEPQGCLSVIIDILNKLAGR